MTTTAIKAHETIAEAAKSPRTEMRMIDSIEIGQAIRQGDVYLVRIRQRHKDWSKKTINRQLAPGTTQGSRHVISAGPSISDLPPAIYEKPAGADVLLGPIIVAKDRFLLEHPEHAHYSMPAGTYQCRYQQEYSEVERRAVRD